MVNDLAKTRQKKTKVSARLTSLYSIEEVPKIIAAAMPFSEEFDDVYFIAMSDAAVSVVRHVYVSIKNTFREILGKS